jgi:hypothetical protein
MAGEVAQCKHLPRTCKAMGSIPRTEKKKKAFFITQSIKYKKLKTEYKKNTSDILMLNYP